MSGYSVEHVAAMVVIAKIQAIESAKSRMNAIVELIATPEQLTPAKGLVAASLADIEAVIDRAVLLYMPDVTMEALQAARKEYQHSRRKKDKRSPDSAGEDSDSTCR